MESKIVYWACIIMGTLALIGLGANIIIGTFITVQNSPFGWIIAVPVVFLLYMLAKYLRTYISGILRLDNSKFPRWPLT